MGKTEKTHGALELVFVWSVCGVLGCYTSSSVGKALVIAQAYLVAGRGTKVTDPIQEQTRWRWYGKRLTGLATPSGSIQEPIDFITTPTPLHRMAHQAIRIERKKDDAPSKLGSSLHVTVGNAPEGTLQTSRWTLQRGTVSYSDRELWCQQ